MLAAVLMAAAAGTPRAASSPDQWRSEWPTTDFTRHSVPFDEIFSGGPPKDGIPAIDDPRILAAAEAEDLAPTEPVIGLALNGDARAYPLRVLIWHEIANDTVGGVPVAVTYCPLCNAAIVFDRRVEGRTLDFGTTGKLRNSDLVMYDRQTESWWQQFTGEAIVGAMTGAKLDMLPSRLESFERFVARHPDGRVLVPSDAGLRAYGTNPYEGYDEAQRPFLYRGDYPANIAPLARVVAVGDEAWSLDLLRRESRVETGDLVITWEPGQNSALSAPLIPQGWDVGNVVVQRRTGESLVDVVHDVTFAFVFHAFRPNGTLHAE